MEVRGISKPWPPGDVYPDGGKHAGDAFSDAENAYLSALPGVPDKVSLRAFGVRSA